MENHNIVDNPIIKILYNISNELMYGNENVLKYGIWVLMEKYQSNEFNVINKKSYYKLFNSFIIVNFFKEDKNFIQSA